MKYEEKYDWLINYCANGIKCQTCGKVEYPFIKGCCNAVTDGLHKYGHKELQIVINIDACIIANILNELGMRVRNGEIFEEGMTTYIGLDFTLPIRFDSHHVDEEPVLRVVLPDNDMYFPEDSMCDPVFRVQLLPTEAIYVESGLHVH